MITTMHRSTRIDIYCIIHVANSDSLLDSSRQGTAWVCAACSGCTSYRPAVKDRSATLHARSIRGGNACDSPTQQQPHTSVRYACNA